MGSVCTPPVDASSAGATSSCTDETSTASSARSRRWRRTRARGSSASVRGLVRDLSTVDGAKGLVEEVLREHGDVDAVFNNAGVYATTFERTGMGRTHVRGERGGAVRHRGWIDTDVGAKCEGVGGKIESVERGVDFGGAED